MCMGLFLSHTTALEALRRWDLRNRLATGERCSAPVPSHLPRGAELAELLVHAPHPVMPGHPIEVVIASGRPGLRASGVYAHLWRGPLPPDSTIRLAEGVVCAAPELVAVQMAPDLTDLELVVLLGELLGLYAVCPGTEDGMFQRNEPLTTPQRMTAYLDALGSRRGTARVRRALARASVRSGSPRETKVTLRLSLKPALGGYGLNVLAMNAPVTVQRINDALATGVRKPDILIGAPQEGAELDFSKIVAVEYNGWRHGEPIRAAQDATRSNELKARGVPEYVIWKEQYDDLDYMDGLVTRIRRDLGMPRIGLTTEVARERRRLRQRLYEELELMDGVRWNGRERERRRAARAAEPVYVPEPDWDVVPVDAYGF